MDDSFPESVEAEEELDLAGAQEGADGFHGALAAGALERVATPDFEDEVTPERAHVAGSALGRRWDEDELDGACVFGGGLGLMRVASDEACRSASAPPLPRSMGLGHAAGLVGIDAVVADGLLASGREVVDGSGDEVGGGENLEVAFDVVVAFGTVDDGLAGGVPGDFLEGEGVAEKVLGEAFAACGVVWVDDFLAPVVDVEAGVFPGEQVVEFPGADESVLAQGVEEAVAEKLDS